MTPLRIQVEYFTNFLHHIYDFKSFTIFRFLSISTWSIDTDFCLSSVYCRTVSSLLRFGQSITFFRLTSSLRAVNGAWLGLNHCYLLNGLVEPLLVLFCLWENSQMLNRDIDFRQLILYQFLDLSECLQLIQNDRMQRRLSKISSP